MLVYGSSGPSVHLNFFLKKNLMAALGHVNFYFTFNLILFLFYFCFDFILILFHFDFLLIFFVNILFSY